MASYHFAVQVLKRSKGHSAVAAAAYRARTALKDERTGEVQDYRRKDGLAHTEIMLPDGAAPWLADRERLWNHVEAIEKRRDAQLAREINMALPHELDDGQRVALVRGFLREHFVSRGMVADFAIHRPPKDSPLNHHAHVMLTLRKATPDGLWRVKTREWNSDELLSAWRAAWAGAQNHALARGGHRDRVDHRTLDAQRTEAADKGDHGLAAILDRAPEIHVGVRARSTVRAGHQPASRERAVDYRKQPRLRDGEKRAGRAARVVDYPKIDRGTRLRWNAALNEINRARAAVKAEKRERQAARFRTHEMRAERRIRELDRKIADARTSGFSFLKPKVDIGRLLRQRSHAVARRDLARVLLGDIERTLARILGASRTRHERSRLLSRAWLPAESGRGRGLF